MHIRPTPPEILPSEPFKNDLLERKHAAIVLTEFVSSLSQPFVLSLDSPWGTGKTTFIRMWKQHLTNEGVRCLYFNAWENDFTESPLVSLVGEIGAGIKSLALDESGAKNARKFFEKTRNAGAALVKVALPTAVKLATSGVLDLSAVTEADLSKLAEDFAKKQIEKYEADKKTIHSFRKELENLARSLTQSDTTSSAKPVVFIIDELDRCRPSYAVELLEKIKHLFSVDGMVFVLAIDRLQLGEAVKCLYGTGIDADGYLRRFIDLEYRLPEPNRKVFAEALFARFGLNEIFQHHGSSTDVDHLRTGLPELFSSFEFSLRVQEQCFTQLVIVVRTTPANYYLHGFLLALLICLRVANRKIYDDYCRGAVVPMAVLSYLGSLPTGKKLVESRLGVLLEAYLIAAFPDNKLRHALLKEQDDTAGAQAGDHDRIKRAREIVRQFQWMLERSEGAVEYLRKKIELTERFVATDRPSQ